MNEEELFRAYESLNELILMNVISRILLKKKEKKEKDTTEYDIPSTVNVATKIYDSSSGSDDDESMMKRKKFFLKSIQRRRPP